MNKIFSWTVGSFFRSIGRILAYLVIGGLIFFLLGKTGLINIMHVKADSVYVNGQDTRYYTTNDHTSSLPSEGWYDYKNGTSVAYNSGYTTMSFFPYANIDVRNIRGGKITIPFMLNYPIITKSSGSNIDFDNTQCRKWLCSSSNNGVCTEYYCYERYVNSELHATISDTEFDNPKVSINAFANYQNGYLDICQVDLDKQEIVCPIANYTSLEYITMIQVNIKVWYGSTTGYNYEFGLHRKVNRWKDSTLAVIDNQNQNTQQVIESQQNQTQELMESNTTQAESEASNFFGNFTTEDHGGINAIITAPLNTIQSLLSSTCTNLVLPLPFVDEDLTLPCMNTIYTEHFGLFFQLYQTIILAIISYRCLRSIFFDINGFTNPDDDRIEVMDL